MIITIVIILLVLMIWNNSYLNFHIKSTRVEYNSIRIFSHKHNNNLYMITVAPYCNTTCLRIRQIWLKCLGSLGCLNEPFDIQSIARYCGPSRRLNQLRTERLKRSMFHDSARNKAHNFQILQISICSSY